MTTEYVEVPELELALDFRWASWDGFDDALQAKLARAIAAMGELEAGAIANPDEGRRVGHYWLRDAALAPSEAERDAILAMRADVASAVGELEGRFRRVLVIGIGGSALGPQLVADALGGPGDVRTVAFLDNTDPDGAHRALAGPLDETLCVVISKSGRTPETRNGYLAAAAAYEAAGLDFAAHAVAVTGPGSELDRSAQAEGWLHRFPMWDWVGGRTSVTSAVGLVPAALQGIDADAMLAGAAEMDRATRVSDVETNPALLLAAQWYLEAERRGRPTMVVLPYKDRLQLLSRYLQQLVMESLGKRLDLDGGVVNQGLTVLGNKGSTDQHAYVQQLRDGRADFFATFVEVLEDGPDLEVEPATTMGDYLSGFLAGTRQALADAGRRSITLTIPRVDARRVGAIIALYERAVGFYATLVHVNAYHQPGVEAGKKAAAALLATQIRLLALLDEGATGTAADFAPLVDTDERSAWHVLRHLAANGRAVERGEGLTRTFSGA